MIRWYPGNYTGFGVKDSRIYVTTTGQVLAVLAQDVDARRADPIVMACGLEPSGNGGECWCVAPLLAGEDEAPFPNACFATVEQVEDYLRHHCTGDDEFDPADPITDDEFLAFVEFVQHRFSPPGR